MENRAIKRVNDNEDKIVGNIKRQFVARNPRFQQHRSVSANVASGGTSLGYLRGIAIGEENGMISMYNFIRNEISVELAKKMRKYIKENKING